jgi:CDP-glycerol glycerophosphotransferase
VWNAGALTVIGAPGKERMPLLSIVVPAHDVAGYLRECLDSILDQAFLDVEVVGVDDHSPDSCGEILDEYARRDPRVSVVHLEQSVGLGSARNAGLDHARGAYVWFVDGDDWLAPGSLSAVARRLNETDPDVLVVDHARAWLTGETTVSGLSRVLPRDSTPDVFTASDLPRALKPLHTVWGKVIRRDFLDEIGLRFRPGWYEDVSFTFPLLLRARRISLLHRVCYLYRQRRLDAITGTRHERHFEVFDQYEALYATLDRWRLDLGALWPVLFDQMLQHYETIMLGEARLPRSLRSVFFDRAAEHYRRYLPADHPAASGRDGRRRRSLARGSWVRYLAKAKARGLARRSIGATKRGAGAAGHLAYLVARQGKRGLMRAYHRLHTHRPLDEHLAVFSAYWGRGYHCNPAAIYEKARELAPGVHGVWVVVRQRAATMPPGVDYVVAGSPAHYRVLARAKFLVNNVNFPGWVVKRPGSVHLQTHHGTPLKVMGTDHFRFPLGARGMELDQLLSRGDRWDFSISTSPFNSEVWQRAYPCRHETLEVGYPRNDRICAATEGDVAAARESLGLTPGETAVLFAPTHRDYQQTFDPLLDLGELADALGPGVRILARLHYFCEDEAVADHPRVLDVSAHPRVEDLYLAADVLVTDYSSAMFDYGHLDRPIAIFAPDWDTYRRTRGVTFDLMAEPPGVVATTFAELVDAFRSGAVRGEAAAHARAAFRKRFCRYGDGRSSERVVRRVFLGEAAEPARLAAAIGRQSPAPASEHAPERV